jgi:HD-GYP domain-containing protein (c-di-GMP phosphodiesterase class II)
LSDAANQKHLHPVKAAMLRFPVESILDNSVTDFDLFIEAAGALTLYAKAPYKWDKDELARLIADGHRAFYHFTEDAARVEAYRLIHQNVKIDTTAPPAQRVVGLTDAAAELTRILYNHPLTPAALGKVGEVAKAMVDCVTEDPACVSALGKLAHHDFYTYYHSARVSAYALAIAMHLSQRDESQLTEMATGAMLHDVGKSKIELQVLNKAGAFTPQEWELMRQHPVFGHGIVESSLLSVMPRHVILHHHERLDGTGYPHNLSERELLEEVKIVSFADVFDALTTNRPYQVSRTHFEALDFIKHKLLKNMHKDSYNALVELLAKSGKKPP